ncbi:MAG: redoxin domain-containing protein [bacterium]|nr:redoxin domain-containing protein [Acidimicrobiia bacterium]MCY4649421.1 redoxin domain-containing protein [bacterium]
MKIDSRLVLLVILAAAVIAVGWALVGGEDGEEEVVSQAAPTVSPSTTATPEDTAGFEPTPSTEALTTVPTTTTTAAPTTTTTISPPEVLQEVHPRLVDIDGWLQSEVESLEELRGQVVVEFWTFACYNCNNRIPYTQQIYAKYRDRGLEIVGIHSPEFNFEEDVDNIKEAMADLGVTWPVVLDTRRRTFWEWQTGGRGYWPRTYVLDREGRVRFDHIGEGKYPELEQTVMFLLNEEM